MPRFDKVNTPRSDSVLKKLCHSCHNVWLPWAHHPVFCHDCMTTDPELAIKAIDDYNWYAKRMEEGKVGKEARKKLDKLAKPFLLALEERRRKNKKEEQ